MPQIEHPLFKFVLILLMAGAFSFTLSQDTGLTFASPEGNASLQIGFNYDYLKNPLSVNYDTAEGYVGLNIPFSFSPSSKIANSLFSSINNATTGGTYLEPGIELQQGPNLTVRVEVPLFAGVASFAYMNMFNMSYSNNLGAPDIRYATIKEDTLSGDTSLFALRGSMNVPVDLRLGWESMTFGYAYKFNHLFQSAVQFHRHNFYFDINGHVDMNLLGTVDASYAGISYSNSFDYPLQSTIDGYYTLQRWTTTIAAKAWRFSLIYRSGFKDEAEGSLVGDYEVPFFIDPVTFQLDSNFNDPGYIQDNIDRFENSEVEKVHLSTKENITWELPHALTIKMELVPEKLSVSYTKMFGDMVFALVDTSYEGEDVINEDINLVIRNHVDHVILLDGRFDHAMFNLGIFSYDVSYNQRSFILRDIQFMIPFGEGVMIPILSFGGSVGSKIEVLAQVDVFPFAAIKTGIKYHF